MEPIKLPNKEEMRIIYRQGVDGMVAFVGSLTGVVQALSERFFAAPIAFAKRD